MPRKGGTTTPPVQDILDCSSSSESLYFDETDRLSPPFAPPTKDQPQSRQQHNFGEEAEQYDLTSVKENDMRGPRSYSLDPFEFVGGDVIVMHDGSRRLVHVNNNNKVSEYVTKATTNYCTSTQIRLLLFYGCLYQHSSHPIINPQRFESRIRFSVPRRKKQRNSTPILPPSSSRLRSFP